MSYVRVVGAIAFIGCYGCAENELLPPGVSVTQVGVLPRTVELAPSATQTFTATIQFSDGSTREVPVSWSTTGGTISPLGAYTAPASSGSYLVIASHAESRVADTAVVTVAPPPAPPNPGDPPAPPPVPPSPPPAGTIDTSLATNLPPSMTLVTDNPWRGPLLTPTSTNWDIWRDPVTNQRWEAAMSRAGHPPVLTTDVSAPGRDSSVLQLSYAGATDGVEPKFPYVAYSAGTEMFFSMWVKFHPQWRQPGHAGVKWLLPADSQGFVGWVGLGPEINGVEGHPNVRWIFQYGTCASGNCPADREVHASPKSAGNLVRGQWNKVQVYIRKNPALIRMWVNDVLIVNKSDFTFNSLTGIREIEFGATWGGGVGFAAPSSNLLWYDRIAVWRRN